jgi:tRNA(Ile)-lysidine synthase
MAATRRLTELVGGARWRLDDLPGGPVTVGLSGGADSATLAYVALNAGLETSALHIDHRLPASPMLAEAAHAIAGRLGIPIETAAVQLGPGLVSEERARAARYAVFDGLARTLLTAHTRDDSGETMLINLFRGTGAAGLTGIPFHRPPNTYRPMLEVTRDRTREIAALAGLEFVDDPMNYDLSVTRNRIRHSILPLIREINPQIDEALARTAASLGRDAETVAQAVPPVRPGTGLPIGLVVTLPPAVADRLIMGLIEQAGIGVTADRIDRVWAVARGESERQDLAGGKTIARRGALLLVE